MMNFNKAQFCRCVTMICMSFEITIPVNGESKQWHEQPVIVTSNLKLTLVFVKHPQDMFDYISVSFMSSNHDDDHDHDKSFSLLPLINR